MHRPSPPCAAPAPRPGTPAGVSRAAAARLLAVLEALLLALLAPRRARSGAHPWHSLPATILRAQGEAPLPVASAAAPLSPPCFTHTGLEHPILYVIGPGPCRGMRPRACRAVATPPPAARAPPARSSPSFRSLPHLPRAPRAGPRPRVLTAPYPRRPLLNRYSPAPTITTMPTTAGTSGRLPQTSQPSSAAAGSEA